MATRTRSRRRTKDFDDALRDVLRSWWVLLALLLWLNWSAFVYAGLRARRKLWLGFGAAYFAASVSSIVLLMLDPDDPVDTWREDVGAMILIFGCILAFVHALGIRRPYLDRMDALDDPRLEAAEDRLLRRERALEIVQENPERALDLGIGRPDVRGAYHGELVDVNHAPAKVLTRLPGFDDELARRTVKVREEINGFSSLEDFGHVMSMPPSFVDRLREDVVFLPR
jgi:Helix-hairpin-helix motif